MSADLPQGDREVPPPTFSLPDAERIVNRLAPSLHAHRLWIQQVHSALVCRSVESCRELNRDPGPHGDLGGWFLEESNEFIRRRPEYQEAMHQYAEVRTRARALCGAVEAGRAIARPEYEAFAEATSRLDKNLEALVKELWDLLRNTDPLTGIATRHALLPRLQEEHQRVQRSGGATSLCMVDLDHFKVVNDSWGHHAGDAVLEAVSAYFRRNLRRYDQVCRYGGEEFLLVLPNAGPEQALPIVDRLRRGIAALKVPFGSEVLRVTASFGIAPLLPGEPVAASIERADFAMYAAKRDGRNRLHVWSENSSPGAGTPLAGGSERGRR
ncbi:MAG: diguanylate cyclase [Rhodospirillales bacterium]|nr:diguanylate cyclase [Rhodospirillales bacterium]